VSGVKAHKLAPDAVGPIQGLRSAGSVEKLKMLGNCGDILWRLLEIDHQTTQHGRLDSRDE